MGEELPFIVPFVVSENRHQKQLERPQTPPDEQDRFGCRASSLCESWEDVELNNNLRN